MNEDFSPAVEPEIVEPDADLLKEGVIEEVTDIDSTLSKFLAEADDRSEMAAIAASAAAEAMVRLAIDQRGQGIGESALGSNAGPPLERYTRWFIPGSGPESWCAFFVSWCLDRVTDSNRRVPWANPGYVPSLYQWAKSTGHLVAKPMHGDIFGLGGEHCGIVAGASPDGGTIWTVEGNYEDKVTSINRRSSGLWFVRI